MTLSCCFIHYKTGQLDGRGIVRGMTKTFILSLCLASSSAFAVFDAADLQTLIAASEAKDSDVLMVWKDGVLLHATDTDATKQYSIQSVTKSLTSLVVSCILKDHPEKLDQTHLFPDWEGTPKADVSVRQLLGMNSGIIDPADPRGRRDFYAHAAGQPLTHAPGTTFSYANVSPMIVGKWIRDTSGQQFSVHAKSCFFDAMGITEWRIGKDAMRNEVVAGGVRILAADLLKIGIMLAQGGVYEGQQLMTPEQIAALRVDPLADGNPYGLGWWLNRNQFYAAGYQGQYLIVVPAERLVVLRLRNRDNMRRTPGNVANWFKELPGLVSRLTR